MATNQQRKRWICRLLCLAMLICLGVGTFPLQAAAAGTKEPILVVSTPDGDEINNLTSGVPLMLKSGACVMVSSSFYGGAGNIYIAIINGTQYQLTPDGTWGNFVVLTVDGFSKNDGSFFDSTASPVVGSSYTLVGYDSDLKIVRQSVTISSVGKQNSDGFCPTKIEGNESDVAYLAVIADDKDNLIAICDSNDIFALSEPSDSSGSSSGGGSSDSDSSDSSSSGGSSDTSPSEDGTSDGSPSRPSREEEQEEKGLPTTAIYIGCGVLAVAVAVGLIMSRKKKPVPMPNDGGGQLNNGEWQPPVPPIPSSSGVPETVYVPPKPPVPPAAPSGVQLSLEVVSGPLAGRSFPISDKPMLIGRALEADIQYPADTKGVSRRHCQLFWEKGTLHIMDLSSTSGTFLRGKGKLNANASVALTAGDTIYLGSKQVALQLKSRS